MMMMMMMMMIVFTPLLSNLKLLPWENRVVFPGESQLRQSRAIHLAVHAACFSVSLSQGTLTWTTGSLTSAEMLEHATAHGDVCTP